MESDAVRRVSHSTLLMHLKRHAFRTQTRNAVKDLIY
jgi:hypothetical protein